MEGRGPRADITARDKDRSVDLLEQYGLPYEQISTQKSGGAAWPSRWPSAPAALMRIMRTSSPDVMTGIMGPSIAAGRRAQLRRVPAVVFYDTEFAEQTNWFVYPLAYSVCTPDCYQGRVPGHARRVCRVPRARLPAPEPVPARSRRACRVRRRARTSRTRSCGSCPGRPCTTAGDAGCRRSRSGTSSRRCSGTGGCSSPPRPRSPAISADLGVNGPVEDIHHLLAHAQLIVGESATMSSEAAVLGVPAVMIATTGRGYTDDQERRYGLVRHFTEDQYDAGGRRRSRRYSRNRPRARSGRPRGSGCSTRRSTSPRG